MGNPDEGTNDDHPEMSASSRSSDSDSDSDDCSSSSSSSSMEGQDAAWDDWVAEDGEEGGGGCLGLPTRCLLSEEVCPGAEEALARDREQGLDLLALIAAHGLDLYGAVRLVNYIRTLVVKEKRPIEAVLAAVGDPDRLGRVLREEGEGEEEEEEEEEGDGARYLCPVLEDDPLLFALGELLQAHGLALRGDGDGDDDGHEQAAAAADDDQLLPEGGPGELAVLENQALRQEVAALRGQVARMSGLLAEMDAGVKVPKPKLKAQDNDTYYFNSYAHWGIHETMLRDRVRTLAYQQAIQAHTEGLIRGKVVLDVGCGTGVLSMFAAKAGARKVVGVDRSDIIDTARGIVARNGLEGTVALVKGKVEEVALPETRVDVIVSEWMGYCLLYESMLPSVLEARDRYLAPGGWLLPNRCTMRVEGVRDLGGRLAFWDDVYGLDMQPLREPILAEPLVECVDAQAVITDGCVFQDLDLMTIRDADLDFTAPFAVRVTAPGGAALRGLVVSFDTLFEGKAAGDPVVSFSTGPECTDTHWHQTLFWLRGAPQEALAVGDVVRGQMAFTRNSDNPREYDIGVEWEVVAAGGGKVLAQGKQTYHLGS